MCREEIGPRNGLLLFCDFCNKGYHLECHSPKLNTTSEDDVLLPLEITVNNQQYTRNAVLFRYFAQQKVDGILPTSGPVVGGTIVRVRFEREGSSSDSTFYCRFGGLLSVGAVVSNDEVCTATPTPTSMSVSVSMSNHEVCTRSARALALTLHSVASHHSVALLTFSE